MPTRTASASLAVAAVLVASGCVGGTGGTPDPSATTGSPDGTAAAADRRFAALETSYDARVSVYARDTGTGRTVTWRSGERFAFASTIKAPLAAAVLDRVSRQDLSQVIRFDEDDLVPYSPVTEQRLDDGMTLREVIDAALRFSDDTAANLLFGRIGGPAGLDRALDLVGDRVTDPERVEPDLNTAVPGDVRDTTTPRAIATTVGTYLLDDILPADDRQFLRTTMVANTTGDALIREGVPDGWVVADKTGSADHGVRNDVAVAFPPGRAPVLIAVMTSRDAVDDASDDAVVADATRVAVDALGLGDYN